MVQRPPPKRKKPRRYHPIDSERFAFDEHENPDWLVGAY
jgi:hypothetical protein